MFIEVFNIRNEDVRPMDSEVFEYGVGSGSRFPSHGMFGALHLPEPSDADEVMDVIAAAGRELDGYGVTTSKHSMETYDALEKDFSGEKPLFGKVSVTKLHDEDEYVDVLTPSQYFDQQMKGDATGNVVTEDWNFYVDLDGDVSQVLVDDYRQNLDWEDEEAVFDSICDSVYEGMNFGGKDTPETDQVNENSVSSFPMLFSPWKNFHSFVDFPEAEDASEFVRGLENAVEQIPDYKVNEHTAGPEGYIYRDNGDIWRGVSRPMFHTVSLSPKPREKSTRELIEKLSSGDIGALKSITGTEEKSMWTFGISYDGESSGFYAKDDSPSSSTDEEFLNELLDLTIEEIRSDRV